MMFNLDSLGPYSTLRMLQILSPHILIANTHIHSEEWSVHSKNKWWRRLTLSRFIRRLRTDRAHQCPWYSRTTSESPWPLTHILSWGKYFSEVLPTTGTSDNSRVNVKKKIYASQSYPMVCCSIEHFWVQGSRGTASDFLNLLQIHCLLNCRLHHAMNNFWNAEFYTQEKF